jgi:hypothetical protein
MWGLGIRLRRRNWKFWTDLKKREGFQRRRRRGGGCCLQSWKLPFYMRRFVGDRNLGLGAKGDRQVH